MKSRLSIPATILTIAIILLIIPVIANAAIVGPNSLKTDLYWSYNDSTYTLTITPVATGTGSMLDFNSTNNKLPWQSFLASMNIICIEEGVTSIGAHAFECDSFGVTSIFLPSSLTKIGQCAFYIDLGCLLLDIS